MKEYKIAIIGECMLELQSHGNQLNKSFGGDTLNTAVYLARLTNQHNLKVSYVTALGCDPFSDEMINAWQKEGVETNYVIRLKDKMPGIYHIENDQTGERKFYYWRSDSAAKRMFDQPDTPELFNNLSSFDAVYLSGVTLAILTEQGRQRLFSFLGEFKGKVFFDNNYRPALWTNRRSAVETYQKMLSFTDTALLTFDDEVELFGDLYVELCIERTSKAGVSEIIIKRGSKDCLIVLEDGQASYVAPEKVTNIIDTTAAGDSFSAGYIAKRVTGGSAFSSARMGHKIAGSVIQHHGAIISPELTPALN